MSKWLDVALARLGGLADLPDGWDSYGAPPISPVAIAAAAQGLRECADLPRPYVYPTTAGGVQLEWPDADDRGCLTIEYLADGSEHAHAIHVDEPGDDDGPEL